MYDNLPRFSGGMHSSGIPTGVYIVGVSIIIGFEHERVFPYIMKTNQKVSWVNPSLQELAACHPLPEVRRPSSHRSWPSW